MSGPDKTSTRQQVVEESNPEITEIASKEYEWGFVTDIDVGRAASRPQ